MNPPELLRYDAQGRHLDDVRFHPVWHLLMQALCTNRVHNLAWEEDARSGAFVARAARFILHAQVEAGSLYPDNHDLCRHAIVVTDVTRAVSGLDHAAIERSLRFSLIAR